MISSLPPVISSSVAAICANSPVEIKPGRTATRKRILSVTAPSAVTIVPVSASGAPSSKSPLVNLVGIRSELKPSSSAVSTTCLRYSKVGGLSARCVPI